MIIAAGAFAYLATLSLAMMHPKWLGVAFPVLFFLALYGATCSVNFAGYAVDARFLDGQEATVIGETESPASIFILVRFASDVEPRLVRLPNTEQNRKGAQKAKEQARQGLAVIRFGNHEASGTPGDADQADGFRLLNLGESKDFGKAP